MTDTIDVREGNERRKQLLAQLLAQLQAQGGMGGVGGIGFPGLGARPVLGGGRFSFGGGGRASLPVPGITQASRVRPGLGLGPGSVGRPGNPFDVSPGPGLPVLPQPARPVTSPSATPERPGLPTNMAPDSAPGVSSVGTSGLIPVGNGLFYDPSFGGFRGVPPGGGKVLV